MSITRMDDPAQAGQQFEQARELLRQHLRSLGLKHSAQRETVLRVFFATRDHLSTEELHHLVQAQDPAIGYSTIYRSLKLFVECGLAAEVSFHDGVARFEHQLNRSSHHHMVCTECGQSVEFFAPEIDAVQEAIGRQFNYLPKRHSFQIYGICEKCQTR